MQPKIFCITFGGNQNQLTDMNKKELGKFLKEKRRALKMTQAELAAKAGLTTTTIQNIEGARAAASWDTLNAITKVLNIKIELK